MKLGMIAVTILVVGLLALAGPAWANTITFNDTVTRSPAVGIFNLESRVGGDSTPTGTTNVSYDSGTDTYSVLCNANSGNLNYSSNVNFHALYKQVTGNFVLQALVNGTGTYGGGIYSFFATDVNTTQGSWNGFWPCYMPNRDSGRFEAYAIANGNDVDHFDSYTGQGAPRYVKLERSTTTLAGDTLTGSYSKDSGVTWIPLLTYKYTAGLAPTLYVGLLTSTTEQSAGTGTFTNMTLTPEPATMALLAMGGVGLLIRRRRQK